MPVAAQDAAVARRCSARSGAPPAGQSAPEPNARYPSTRLRFFHADVRIPGRATLNSQDDIVKLASAFPSLGRWLSDPERLQPCLWPSCRALGEAT